MTVRRVTKKFRSSGEDWFGVYQHNEGWEDEWKDMPEFKHQDLRPKRSVLVHFRNESDIDEFAKLIDQRITPKTRFVWFPNMLRKMAENKRYVDES